MYKNLEFCPETSMCTPKKNCLGIRIIGSYERYELGLKPMYVQQFGKNAFGFCSIVVITLQKNGFEYTQISKQDVPDKVKDYMRGTGWKEY